MSVSLPPPPMDTNKTPEPLSALICGPEADLSGLGCAAVFSSGFLLTLV